MKPEQTTRRVNSMKALGARLDAIEAGREPKPDWIQLQASCRLDRVPLAEREALVRRMHGCVLRGFRANNAKPRNRAQSLEYWTSLARNGFHDFSEHGWMKCYDSPFIENYDYVTDYRKGGLEALDPYQVYSSVLGTFDYGVEDFVGTDLCSDVGTVIEPMAGSAELAYAGHFQFPGFRYVMIDLDSQAREHVLARPWLPDTEKHYVLNDVLDESIWEQVKSLSTGRSLAYIGKQSHHFFDAKQLLRLLSVATQHVDYFMLETPQVTLVSDMDPVEDLTRPEMEDAGFEVALVDEPGGVANPFTNKMSFDLEASDKQLVRTLFRYPDWTAWQHPTLVAMADLLDLQVFYYHSEHEDFVPVDEGTEDTDCHDNVTFMLFTRHT